MPSAEQLRTRLLKKLKELFLLDQPDLDFGFYRIMHAKSEQVKDFIDQDLFKIITDEFGEMNEIQKNEFKAAYEKAVETARGYGSPDPDNVPAVQEARARFDAAKDTSSAEADIYDHLYRFFERYYDSGDFISRRYYTRETSGKAAPFAIPYNGEEVKLYWANADQYYIKTDEYFSNFTFDLRESIEVQGMSPDERILNQIPTHPVKVHFRIVEASEGEHGNLKASESYKRFFIIHADKPVEVTEDVDLIVNFEYRPDPEKTGQENIWREKRNGEAVETILANLERLARKEKKLTEHLRLLKIPAPTEKDKKRSLLAKYINRYTAHNTMDYFIHKDLGGFLRRELDFYIKNEVMRLDDIEYADAPAVESYLAKIKVLRKIARKLIDFLAQLENFQKKLWLKKKFVVETNYCITLDRVPEDLYPEIAANKAQHDEWVKLFAINEIERDLSNPGYSKPLTVKFLKANNKLVLDTRFFDEKFKARLIAAIDNFDDQCDGLLIHSENFQALSLLQERYRKQVQCVYIDPPFNTSATEILYKNEYKHSSWLSLIQDRIASSYSCVKHNGVFCIAIDDFEGAKLQNSLDATLGFENRLGNIVVVHNPGGRHDDKFIATAHEYCFYYGKHISETDTNYLPLEDKDIETFNHKDEDGAYRTREFRRSGNNSTRGARPKMFYPLLIKEGKISLINDNEYSALYDKEKNYFNDSFLEELKTKYTNMGFDFILPIDPKGTMRVWRWTPETFKDRSSEVYAEKKKNSYIIKVKDRLENKLGLKPKSIWYKSKYTAALGTNLLKSVIGKDGLFSYPKSVATVEDSIRIGANKDSLILDYFGGSGTTGHAVINLNREDDGKRKYILVEMGDYFDTVLKPRIAKVVYSESWKDGKPTKRESGISHCFKYMRLESYEDTLNNLRFDDNPKRNEFINKSETLKEDYILHYLLDVETRGSQSLLNINAFVDPTAYTLKVKKPGSDEYALQYVDLIETFNYLIGLRVNHIAAPQTFKATFKRNPDPELPKANKTKLVVDGRIKIFSDQTEKYGKKKIPENYWWFQKIEGWVLKNPANHNLNATEAIQTGTGSHENILIVWRKLTDDLEKDNAVLDEWFRTNCISTQDFEFGTIYVNGSNNLPNLKREGDTWKVRLIEEEFMKRMWETRNI